MAFGVGLFTFLIDTEAFGAGILKLISSVCGSSIFAASLFQVAAGDPLSLLAILYYISSISFLLIYLFHKDEKSILMWILFLVHTVSLGFGIFYFDKSTLQEFLYLTSSSILLGTILFSMLLGHWYLVNPKLSEKPLLKTVLFMWSALAMKIIWTCIYVFQNYDFFDVNTIKGAGYSFNWIMLLMRVGWGYVIVLIMSIFAWKLVRMRSIQSATGMFYAMVFLVFIGELVATFIYFKYGMLL